MSGSIGGIVNIVVQGFTTMTTVLQNIQLALGNLITAINTLAIGASANNNFTGDNTFTGANSFKPPPSISAGATGAATFFPSGALSNQTAVAGIGNGANTTDDLLFSYTLPANSLDLVGRGIIVEAYGLFGANGNDKAVKLFINAFAWFNSGVVTLNATGWYFRANMTLSAANEVTGNAFAFSGAALLGGVGVGSLVVATNVPIVLTVTGASPTTGAANDVKAYGMTVTFLN